MDKINHLANSALQNGQQKPESRQSESLPNKKRMTALWERMTHIYGHRWTASFGESATNPDGTLTDAAKTWATGLRDITGEQIATGLHQCCDDASNEWPSLPMFKAKCRPQPTHAEHAEMYRVAPKGLPEPGWRKEERKAKAVDAIAALRDKIRSGA